MDRLGGCSSVDCMVFGLEAAATLPLTSKHRGTNMKKFFIPLFAALLSCSAFAADAPTLAECR